MKKILLYIIIIVFSYQLSLSNEQIMRAMRDEINRSMNELVLEGLLRPYYIEYSLSITEPYTIKAVLGNLTESTSGHNAILNVSVRVGDYHFDNTNFFDIGLSFFGSGDDEEVFRSRRIPYEISYGSLRRELWLATDAAYKQAAEVFSKKEASLKNKVRKDTTHDFLRVSPRVSFDTNFTYKFDVQKFEQLARELSSVIRKYPTVSVSQTAIEIMPETIYYVNSEGMEYVKKELFAGIEVTAATQSADGMTLTDFYSVYSVFPEDLPQRDSLVRSVELLAKNITNLTKSEAIDEPYSGPVLFIGQAAGEIIAQSFAPNLVAQRQPITEGGFTDTERFAAFQNRVGGRVLPEFISVSAKPSITKHLNVPLVGSFKIDDSGLNAEDVLLVDNGYLRNLLSARVPTRRIRESNGHNRGGSPMLSNIFFTAKDNQLSDKDIKEKMIKMINDRELPYGIIVKRIQNQNIMFTGLYRLTYGAFDFPRGLGRMMINEAYKIFPDGREELIRGSQIANLTPQSFRDIMYVGNTHYVLNYLAPAVVSSFISGGKSYIPVSIAAFDLLFEDAEIRSPEGDFTKPPFVARPKFK